jgi:hypothetical protein
MNITKTIDQFNKDYIYICDPIKNNIMMDSNFIRILYSNELFTLNGIYLYINFNNMNIDKYYNKYKCIFDINTNIYLINKLKEIEIDILTKINVTNKIPVYKIYDQLCTGNIKIFPDNIDTMYHGFILKISGIWETDNNYGVTYKFMSM